MARALSNAGIVTSNISTQPEIEYRYRLTQNISSKEALKVECSYDYYILNYLRPSLCYNTKD